MEEGSEGQKLRLKVRVRSDGAAYVNGRKMGKKFNRDGTIPLAKSAVPGEEFVIAVKASDLPADTRRRISRSHTSSGSRWIRGW